MNSKTINPHENYRRYRYYRFSYSVGSWSRCTYPSIHFFVSRSRSVVDCAHIRAFTFLLTKTLSRSRSVVDCVVSVCVHLVWWRVCMYMWRCVYMLCCVLCCGVVLRCCGVVLVCCCVVWLCGMWHGLVRGKKTLRVHVQLASVCTFKMPPCVLARRPHVEQHPGVLPIHTKAF